jgi:hypothetical protein
MQVAALPLRHRSRVHAGLQRIEAPMINDDDAELLLDVLDAWHDFKVSHNVRGASLACCEKTVALFNALEKLDVELYPDGHEERRAN